MTNRFIHITVAVVALVGLAGQVRTTGQAPQNASSENGNHFMPSKTPWGDPDLSGHWLPGGGGRMETPAGKPWEGPRSTPADAVYEGMFRLG